MLWAKYYEYVIVNNYPILNEKIEANLALQDWEVKALRACKANIS